MINTITLQLRTAQNPVEQRDTSHGTIDTPQHMRKERTDIHCICEHCISYRPTTFQCEYYDFDWDAPESESIGGGVQ